MRLRFFLSAFVLLSIYAGVSQRPVFSQKLELPEGPGKEITVKLCGTCHAAELVMNRRETIEGWSGVVEDMIRRGAQGTHSEFGEVVDYLVAHFPKTPPAQTPPAKTPSNQINAQ